jgi:hypothetical protein
MKKTHILGLTLIATFAASAFITQAALAVNPEWLTGGNPIAEPLAADSASSLELILVKDYSTGVDALWSMTREGSFGPGAHGLIERITVTATEVDEGSCGSQKIEAENLPWSTELQLTEAGLVDDIGPDGKGNPAWLVECTTFGIKIDDLCEATLLYSRMSNEAGGVVDQLFDENLGPFPNCSVGGTEQGLIEGLSTETRFR